MRYECKSQDPNDIKHFKQMNERKETRDYETKF